MEPEPRGLVFLLLSSPKNIILPSASGFYQASGTVLVKPFFFLEPGNRLKGGWILQSNSIPFWNKKFRN
ncbi:hypothetical protein KFK09_021725 [Dendrobium nobile]|uniref:Uncharacterized protein n=1 Tax=Dendrobium nobile TaxID=94219 RepID=A0A8T3AH71_DENNO|nr:hypothetical protein KFK09_021725 [Dendrobium nobile]